MAKSRLADSVEVNYQGLAAANYRHWAPPQYVIGRMWNGELLAAP